MNIHEEVEAVLADTRKIAFDAATIISKHVPEEAKAALIAELLAELNEWSGEDGFGRLGDTIFIGLLSGLGKEVRAV